MSSSGISTYTIYDGLINWNNSVLDTNSIYKIPKFGAGSDYWIMTDFPNRGSNNCVPTAATNVLWYFGWKYGTGSNNNITDRLWHMSTNWDKMNLLHDTLAAGMGTSSTGTNFLNTPAGFENFFGPTGYSWNYKYLSGFNAIYNTITETYPIMVDIHYGNDGHAMFGIGRANGNTGVRYIMVMDGWHRYGRYVREGYYDIYRGYKIGGRI